MPLTFGSLFSGVGGLDKGFCDAGFRCEWQCEINADCRTVNAASTIQNEEAGTPVGAAV